MFIPQEKYIEIIDWMPITCIDFFIVHWNNLLLWKRNNEPYKWEWFVPWWRIEKSETQEKAIQRKLFEETWIRVDKEASVKLLWVYDTIFKVNAFSNNQLTHTINITYIVNLHKKDSNISNDRQNEEFKRFDMDSDRDVFNEYIKKLIIDYRNIRGK